MIPLIWYVHGANASPVSFNYLKDNLPPHDCVDWAYHCDNPVYEIIEEITEAAKTEKRPINLIGHSLGGLISIAVSHNVGSIAKIATLGSPLGGSKIASLMRWIVPNQLLNDIHPHSALVSSLRRTPITVPVMSIVTTAGHTILMNEPNDGVVTVTSQQELDGPVYIKVPHNHFEVLLSDTVADLLTGFIFEE